MEPSLRQGDLVFYFNKEPSIGDIVVWCSTPNYCIVHRFLRVWEYNDDYIVTKGDANPFEDNPIPMKAVRGVVLFTAPRELWIPILLLALLVAFNDLARARFIGYSYVVALATALLYLIAVYAIVPPPPVQQAIELPRLHLSSVSFDSSTCSVVVKYVGQLYLMNAAVRVNEVSVEAYFNETYVVAKPPIQLISHAVEEGEHLRISVFAELNNAGVLRGEYEARVSWHKPGIRVENSTLVIENPNCYPIAFNITFLYAHRPGESWRALNQTVVVGGFEKLLIQPPSAAYIYVDVYYIAWGSEHWLRLLVK